MLTYKDLLNTPYNIPVYNLHKFSAKTLCILLLTNRRKPIDIFQKRGII